MIKKQFHLKTKLFTLFFIGLSLLLAPQLIAQDLHFSQFYHSPLNINPALTGVFKGDLRFAGNYRRQWQSVPIPYLTFSAAFDMKYFHRKLGNGFFAGGFIFDHDKSGDAEMRYTQITFSGSYTHQLNENH